MSAYPEAQDIKENFLISSNGIVYEGRGFSKEGQHTQGDKTEQVLLFLINKHKMCFQIKEEHHIIRKQ